MKTGPELIREIHEAKVAPGRFALWWLGQQGWVVKTAACLAGIDLFLSPHPKRRYPALVNPGEIAGFDLILGTHDHKDHIDREAWPAIANASPAAQFVIPQRSFAEVTQATGIAATRFIGLDDGKTTAFGDVVVSAVPSAHEWLDNIPEAGGQRYLGYVLDAGDGAVYHAGDTCLWEGLTQRLSPWTIRAALLPINGRDAERHQAGVIGCMVYQEAGDLASRIKAGIVIPGHYDAFSRDTVDPQLFADYVRSRYPEVVPLTPERGVRIDI